MQVLVRYNRSAIILNHDCTIRPTSINIPHVANVLNNKKKKHNANSLYSATGVHAYSTSHVIYNNNIYTGVGTCYQTTCRKISCQA